MCVIVSESLAIVGRVTMSAQLSHEVANCPRRLVPQPAMRICIIHHADETTARREQAPARRNRAADIAGVMQATDCHECVERAPGKGRRENIALDGLSGKPALAQAMIYHSDRVGGDVETSEECAVLCKLLRNGAITQTDFEDTLAAETRPRNVTVEIRVEP